MDAPAFDSPGRGLTDEGRKVTRAICSELHRIWGMPHLAGQHDDALSRQTGRPIPPHDEITANPSKPHWPPPESSSVAPPQFARMHRIARPAPQRRTAKACAPRPALNHLLLHKREPAFLELRSKPLHCSHIVASRFSKRCGRCTPQHCFLGLASLTQFPERGVRVQDKLPSPTARHTRFPAPPVYSMMIDTLYVRRDDAVHTVDNRLCDNSLVRGRILPAKADVGQSPHQGVRLRALPE